MTLDGGAVQVTQDGPRDAPALVLLHGLGASSHWWDAVVPMLARSHRVIRIDLLGHCGSAKPDGDSYGICEQAPRVVQVLDRLGVTHAVLVGHCTGGYVATALAEQGGDLVTALALVDTGPRWTPSSPTGRSASSSTSPCWDSCCAGADRRRPAPRAEHRVRPGIHRPAAVGRRHPRRHVPRPDRDVARGRQLPERTPGAGPARPARQLLLVVFGERDQRWHASSAASYRAVPGATVELVPGAGPSPMVEDPPRTAALLLGFVTTVLGHG